MEISYEAVFNAHMRQLTVSTITFNTKKVWDSSSTYRGSEIQKGQQRRSLGRLREQVNTIIYFKRTSDIGHWYDGTWVVSTTKGTIDKGI